MNKKLLYISLIFIFNISQCNYIFGDNNYYARSFNKTIRPISSYQHLALQSEKMMKKIIKTNISQEQKDKILNILKYELYPRISFFSDAKDWQKLVRNSKEYNPLILMRKIQKQEVNTSYLKEIENLKLKLQKIFGSL